MMAIKDVGAKATRAAQDLARADLHSPYIVDSLRISA